jgi:hypothetical protein
MLSKDQLNRAPGCIDLQSESRTATTVIGVPSLNVALAFSLKIV